MKQETLQTPDSLQLSYGVWEPESKPRAAVLLLHGMAEHPARYEELGQFLSKHGFVVYAPAHRGHGSTGHNMGKMGFFAPKNGWQLVLDDIAQVHRLLQSRHPEIPVLGIGHSMGSFLMRCYLQNPAGSMQGVVLCGTGGPADLQIHFFSLLTRTVLRFSAPDRILDWINALGNRQTSHFLRNPRTPSDWISTDAAQVDSYVADPDCGFACTTSFWNDLLTGWKQFSNPKRHAQFDRTLPLLLIAGTQDPVGKFGRGVLRSGEFYRKLGLHSVEVRLFCGLRHALFEERNREEIFEAVLKWMEQKLNKGCLR